MVNLKNVEYDLRPLKHTVKEIKSYDYTACTDDELCVMTEKLREHALSGADEAVLLPELFALVAESVKRALGLYVHDNQLMAASAMAHEQIVELSTGEGKTLAAVFTAVLKALAGKGVHILTFNDYLARRDAEWMAPVYSLLGLSVKYITEGMTPEERKMSYSADITYVTAKEAGFDYLRGFLAYKPEHVVHRLFHFAIIDEIDSILIDEARIPLVIAADEPSQVEIDKKIFAAVEKLVRGVHFGTDENDSIIYLEDTGIGFVEAELGIKDIYDGKHIDILSKVNVVLQAQYMLKRDVDYIVKNGEILLVDEFTGRVAKNRQWSDGLHAAVEFKEGLTPTMQGRIMNSITLHSFLRLYPGFCGMTGTAVPAASEFMKFYDRSVTVIPPNLPCIRTDHPDVIYSSRERKFRAVAEEIVKTHHSVRPVLVGTSSVEESEYLADLLRGDVPGLNVLNAKNDAEEAAVIADAGKLGAVTISTNMAGRGVDIRLGGKDGVDYDEVCRLGGLYVISTNRHESVRVDNQLRGRAGRQGDPGESRFFISLEDSLIQKYGLTDRLPERYRGTDQDGPLESSAFRKAVVRTQRYVEAQTFDAKTTLFKYAAIVEDQRSLVYKKREDILLGRVSLSLLIKEKPEMYRKLLEQVSEDVFNQAQKQIEMYVLGRCWSDHLLYVESLRDEIYILGRVRGDPLTRYNERLIEGFRNLEESIREMVLDIFDSVIVKDGRIDLEEMGIRGPTSTRTYLVHDGTEDMGLLAPLGMFAAAGWTAPLYLLEMILGRMKKPRA